MKKNLLLLLALSLAPTLRAQTMPEVAGPVETSPSDRFLLQNGEVVLVKGKTFTALTRNVLLGNGTKINYRSGIVELPGGKITTLQQGDYVRPDGSIIFGSPASAAQARGDNSVPADTRFDTYVDPRPAPATAAALESRLSGMNAKISLMAEKIGLLNQKITLLSGGQQKVDTSSLDQQIQAIDAKLR